MVKLLDFAWNVFSYYNSRTAHSFSRTSYYFMSGTLHWKIKKNPPCQPAKIIFNLKKKSRVGRSASGIHFLFFTPLPPTDTAIKKKKNCGFLHLNAVVFALLWRTRGRDRRTEKNMSQNSCRRNLKRDDIN